MTSMGCPCIGAGTTVASGLIAGGFISGFILQTNAPSIDSTNDGQKEPDPADVGAQTMANASQRQAKTHNAL